MKTMRMCQKKNTWVILEGCERNKVIPKVKKKKKKSLLLQTESASINVTHF